MEEFRTRITKRGEYLVFKTFPEKIYELQQIIDSAMANDSSSPFNLQHVSTATDTTVYPPPSIHPSDDEPQTKKRKLINAVDKHSNDSQNARLANLVLANEHMPCVHEIIKRESQQLALFSDEVRLWVSLTMPKIEDGDNFGVQIQEEVLGELHRAQDSAYNLRDAARQDYLARAKICSKLIKYPHIEDYTLALKEHDERQFYLARQHLIDIRNMYAVLTDLIHKNISKIRAPKGNNSVGLY